LRGDPASWVSDILNQFEVHFNLHGGGFAFGFFLGFRRFDFAEVLEAVGDGEGSVFFAGFGDALGPDRIGEVEWFGCAE
jgi:hypothetical protein